MLHFVCATHAITQRNPRNLTRRSGTVRYRSCVVFYSGFLAPFCIQSCTSTRVISSNLVSGLEGTVPPEEVNVPYSYSYRHTHGEYCTVYESSLYFQFVFPVGRYSYSYAYSVNIDNPYSISRRWIRMDVERN